MRYTLILCCFLACTPKPQLELNLVVAASVGPAAQALASKLEKEGVKVNVHAGASSLVARQIVNGLACDAVVLADEEWMDYLVSQNAINQASRKPLLGNELVWVTKKGTQAGNGKIALADPEHVPAGKYAKAALVANKKWDSVAAKVVAAPDVRTALLWVERGEVDKAVVYATDALGSKHVEVQSRLESVKPVIYPMATCRSAHSERLSAILTSDHAKRLFREYGFVVHERG